MLRTRKRKQNFPVHVTKDPYRALLSFTNSKVKCNQLIVDMLKFKKGEQLLVFDSEIANSTNYLERDGHDSKNIVVINKHADVCKQLRQLKPDLQVYHGLAEKVLLHNWDNKPPFSGGWIDTTGSAFDVIKIFTALFSKDLIKNGASFGITWCLRSGAKKLIATETHESTHIGLEQLTKIAREHNFAMIHYPHGFNYKNMFFTRVQFERAIFESKFDSDAFQSVITDDEFEVESIIGHRYFSADEKGEAGWYMEVKWVGYQETTWEPAAMLKEDCIDIYSEYLATNRIVF
jgi:hypothetical protein